MTAPATVEMTPGAVVVLDGIEYTVVAVDWIIQTVTLLRAGDDERITWTLDEVHACRVSAFGGRPTAPPRIELLRAEDRKIAQRRLAHALEAATGYRSGTPDVALPHEPRPQYDPERTPAYQRRAAKAEELATDPDKAEVLMSAATLRRIAERHHRGEADAAIDGRKARRRQARTRMTGVVEKAAWEVVDRLRDESNVSMRTRHGRVIMLLTEWQVSEDRHPSLSTVERWHRDHFTTGQLRGKARTNRSATKAPKGGFKKRGLDYAGGCVVLDSYNLDVMLKGTRWSGLVRGVLVIAIDWYSRSVVALRVLETADTGQDVGFVCREIARPKPMRAGWGDHMRWAYVGMPETVLLPENGKHFAALPYVVPRDITQDHGATYKNYNNVRVLAGMGSSILPARKGTGPDKAVVERFFGSLKTMLLEFLDGFRGSDVSERGSDVEQKRKYSASEFEELLLRWVVLIWQNHPMEGVRPPGTVNETEAWSPNMMYENSVRQHGIGQPLLTDDGYVSGLPTKQVRVHQAGIKIGPLVYDAPELDPFRGQPNPLSRGRDDLRNTYEVKTDKRDRRTVWLFHPILEGWVRADWNGAPREDVPVFGEEHVLKLSRLLKKSQYQALGPHELLRLLMYDVLGLDQPAPEGRDAQQDSRARHDALLAERDREDHGMPDGAEVDSTPEPPQPTDERRLAKAALANARAEVRKRGMATVPAAGPCQEMTGAKTRAASTRALAPKPVGRKAAPLGSSFINPFARPSTPATTAEDTP